MVHSSSPDIDIVCCSVAETIPGLMFRRNEPLPNAVAYPEFAIGGAWRDVTLQEMARNVARYRTALDLAGLACGDPVAVLLANSIDWITFDTAATANGLITVVLDFYDSAANLRFILMNSSTLHTGDIAEFRVNRLGVIGRLKELIALSTGKKVVSANLEAEITADPLFYQCCVFGDNHPAIVALVVHGRDRCTAFAKLHHRGLDDPNKPTARSAILTRIKEATQDQPRFARVHALLQPWTVEDGSLTPTLKIKPNIIKDRDQTEIEDRYARQAARRHHES